MKIISFYIIYGLIAIILESTILNGFPFGRLYSIDLIFMGVAAVAFDDSVSYRWWLLFILGAFKDIASSIPWGVSIFSFIVVVFLYRLISKSISSQTGIGRIFWTAILSLSCKFIISGIIYLYGMPNNALAILKHAPLQAIGDGIASLLFVALILKLTRHLKGSERPIVSKGAN